MSEQEAVPEVRAKFTCEVVTENPGGESANIRLLAVVSGSPENDEFFKYTPNGCIELGCANPVATARFEVGKQYYVDFTPAA